MSATNKGIPGIPDAALDSISDENTRLVLRALVDGWNVRNAASGSGDSAFITKGEIDGLTARSAQKAVANLGGMRLDPGEISRMMDDLHSQVFESKLFKDLEERVDLIDKPGGIFDRVGATELALVNETTQRITGQTALSTQITALGTRIGTAEAGLIAETTQRVNADNALQTTISTQYAQVSESLALQQSSIVTNANAVAALTTQYNQIQASVGNLSAALAVESEVRANADNTLYGQYTLRIDINGRVSGFGLAASPTVSDFIVRADRFSIVSPNGNQAAVIMSNNTINVYDENGALRVRIGRLA